MEYYSNILCVEAAELISAGVMSESYYKQLKARKQLRVVNRACRNIPALIAVESLPARFYSRMVEVLGDPKKLAPRKTFEDRIVPDPSAMQFFSGYRTVTGKQLPDEKIAEYCMNASVLNALTEVLADKRAARGVTGGKTTGFWAAAAEVLGHLKARLGHSLPENPIRLKEKFRSYLKDGYSVLVSGKFGNNNSRKVNELVEQMILSLYIMPNKPYAASTHEMYLQFLAGTLTVADTRTGEIFNRDDFYDAKGNPILISESTVWNYLNDPRNRAVVDKARMGTQDYLAVHRPHHIRRSPDFSFSKISMDDRDLPRKMHDGTTVKAYYAYDVASGCVIGRAYSRKKNTGLFVDCVRDMFRFIDAYGIGMPMEVEVEHHLVNQFADDLMRAGILFPFVRWCNPGNSQEKRAEHFNREKKYGYEKRYQEGIGRFYARLEANRPKREKIFDEDNDRYREKTFSFEELVADDLSVIETYNSDLHRNQKKYPGKTRLQVMLGHKNPHMAAIDRVMLTRYIGESTRTSIRRNMYVRVQYQDFRLSSPYVLENLSPNSYEVDAYYMPSADIPEVYIFQNGVYIDTCRLVVPYNEATAEQTEADRRSYAEQARYVAGFDRMVKEGRSQLAKVALVPDAKPLDEVPVSPSPLVHEAAAEEEPWYPATRSSSSPLVHEEEAEEEPGFDAGSYLATARRLAKSSL